MPKKLADDLIEQIEAQITRHPEGVGVNALHSVLAPIVSRRTLQRRLADLARSKRVVARGNGPGLRYGHPDAHVVEAREPDPAAGRPTTRSDVEVEHDVAGASAEARVKVSAEGDEIRRLVRRPRAERAPVSYNQAFLEQYSPNHSSYLPAKLRAQLHDLGRPSLAGMDEAPAGSFARDVLNRLLIDLSWASSRLEGNTYSRLDTERLIELGQAAVGKDALETQMILNHKAAIEYLVSGAGPSGERADVRTETIIALHAFLSDGLMPDPAACGRLRRRLVEIGGSVYLPIAVPQRIEELFGVVIEMAAEIRDPFEQSFFLLVHLPYLQPFEDVNKRVSRLAANIPFIQHNLSPLSFVDVAETDYVDGLLGVYELNRIELLRDIFVQAYQRSCQQYVAVRQQLVPPDPLRLRYRHQLSAVVAAIVRGGLAPDPATIAARVPSTVVDVDRERFIALNVEEFRHLHAGNVVRFGLRPLEFAAWRERRAE